MLPIFFPYTYLPEETAIIIHRLFGKVVVYLPSEFQIPLDMQDLDSREMVSLEFPLAGKTDQKELEAVLAQYDSWASLHGVKGLESMRGTHSVPFFDDRSPLSLRDAIRERKTEQAAQVRENPDLLSQVFLHMAQRADIDHYEVTKGFRKVREKEESFKRELAGLMDETDSGGLLTHEKDAHFWGQDPAMHLTPQRMSAWARLFAADNVPCGFFISTNQEAAELLFEHCCVDPTRGEFRVAAPNEDFSVWKTEFMSAARLYVTGEVDAPSTVQAWKNLEKSADNGESKYTFVLYYYLVDGVSPQWLFSQTQAKKRPDLRVASIKNSLVCILGLDEK